MPRLLIAIGLLLAAMTQGSAALAQQQAETARPAGTAFETRAGQLVDLLSGRLGYADYFAPVFQQAVPEAQFKAITTNLIAQYGEPVAVVSTHAIDARRGTATLRFEKAVGTVALSVEAGPDRRVDGLRFQNFEVANDSFARVAAELAALPGETGFLVAEVDSGAPRQVAGAQAAQQFAVGSTFKLYILDELAAQVAAGKHRWDEVVPLSHLSFSSAATAGWPKNTPVTLQTLANWMISVSDNGAADTLIHLLGRKAIEARMRAAGNSDPSRTIPFLTTVEAFALKGDNFAAERAAFLAGDDEAQRAVIDANSDRLVLENVDGGSFGGKPRFIDSLEWFASPMDVARVLIDLKARGSTQAMAAMAINSGVGPVAAADWQYLGYKGGSELGVLSMSLLGQRKSDGKWFVVTASWNNPDGDAAAETINGLVTRLLALAAKA